MIEWNDELFLNVNGLAPYYVGLWRYTSAYHIPWVVVVVLRYVYDDKFCKYLTLGFFYWVIHEVSSYLL